MFSQVFNEIIWVKFLVEVAIITIIIIYVPVLVKTCESALYSCLCGFLMMFYSDLMVGVWGLC